jgi:hypothetical protein
MDEPEADTPLVIDRDRMLASPISFERMEAIPRGHFEVVQHRGQVDILQLSGGADRQIGRKSRRGALAEQLLGTPVREGLDHAQV